MLYFSFIGGNGLTGTGTRSGYWRGSHINR